MDFRQRILKAYDRGDATREQVAKRFGMSVAMVKKLIQQHRHTGSIAPLHHRGGRKPLILDNHRRDMRLLPKHDSRGDAEGFRSYIREILLPMLSPGDILIMDNLSAHKDRKASVC